MKKLLILGLMLIALPALATTICADDDVIAIVLDPMVSGTGVKFDANLSEWGAVFPYGSVWGISTCMDVVGTLNTATNELRSADGELATGGERKGRYCWCQMTHPAISRWVYRYASPTANDCSARCADYCSYVSNNIELRAGVFNAIAY